MSIDHELITTILPRYHNLLDSTNCLNHTEIAKAIEQERKCQIFIFPLLEDEPLDNSECESFTATCEPLLLLQNESCEPTSGKTVQDHFVFFRPDSNKELEYFRVCHELGHLALHWPLDEDREARKIESKIEGVGQLYLIQFRQNEEEAADAFASLLRTRKPMFRRQRQRISVNKATKIVGKFHKKKGFFQSLNYTEWE